MAQTLALDGTWLVLMKIPIVYKLMAALAWVLFVAVLMAWTGEWAAGLHGGATRIVMLGMGLLAAGLAFAVLHYHLWRQSRNLRDYFHALCRTEPRDLDANGQPGGPRPLTASSPWHDIAGLVQETILRHCRRIQELEHLRTASEIRYRRAKDECEQIKTIFAGVAEPILAVNDYNELVLTNQSAEDLLHLDAERAEDRALARLLQCEKLVGLLAATAQRKLPGNRSEEVEIVDGSGQAQWYRATATKLTAAAEPAEGQAGSSPGVVLVLRDIGELKGLQKRNAEFVSAVSHEMKTPLAGIKAYVELLADGDAEDDQTREEFLNVIDGQADRLQRLVENLLNLARIEAGVVKVAKQPRSLNELLEEAIRVVQPAAEAKNITLVSDLSPLYLSVLADRDMLLQAAINLLSNAIKYTRDGGQVSLRSRMADDDVQFEVEDTGVGLSEQDCQRVFEKFYRVSKDKNMASGTGLGLPLAKHIVEDVHGGRLTVTSKLGEGSTFLATLPCAKQLT